MLMSPLQLISIQYVNILPLQIIQYLMKNYKKNKMVGEFGDNGGLLYQVIKEDKKYFLYQFQQFGDAETYNFKILGKLMSSHILAVVDQFQEDGVKYFVTDYAEKDLLSLQTSQPNRVFPLNVALDYFSKIILAIQQMHDNKLVYRNIRQQSIKIRDEDVYFNDFILSQFCKRKQRLFDIVGCQHFLGPEFFLDDGYSFEVDVWAAGVLLYYMLTNQYPFKYQSKSKQGTLEELKKTMNGFSFEKKLEQCKNPGFIKSNKILQDFFARIFCFDEIERITIKQIKAHKLMSGFFPEKIDNQILEAIGQQQSNINSLMTKFSDLSKFKLAQEVEKQQLILDFIERCSETLMIDCSAFISQDVRNKIQFSILKMGMIRVNVLINFCFGKGKPEFQYDEKELALAKATSAFKKVVEGIERKKKILYMSYRSAFLNIQNSKIYEQLKGDPFFSLQVPDDFNQIKITYRLALSQMFEISKTVMSKNKSDKPLMRKLTQLMARMVIMHLVNRIFERDAYEKNLALYIEWNKTKNKKNKPNLQQLDEWIHSQKQANLRHFIKQVTKMYL